MVSPRVVSFEISNAFSSVSLDVDQSNDAKNKDTISDDDGSSLSAEEAASRTAHPFAGYVNLLKTCIGAGILALPYAFSQTGWALGLVILITTGVAAAYALFLLSAIAHKLGTENNNTRAKTNTSYSLAINRTFPWAQSIVDFLILFNGFGSAASYLIVIGENLSSMAVHVFGIPTTSFASSPHFWKIVFFWAIIAPLVCLKKLSALKYTSVVGLVCALYVCILTVVYLAPSMDACEAYLPLPHCGGEVVAVSSDPESIMSSIPMFAFAFTCSQNIFLVYNEIREPSLKRMRNFVGTPSMMTALCVYIITAMSAYFTFGSLINSDLILSYPDSDIAVDVASFFIVLITTASSPLQIHPARQAFTTLIYYLVGIFAKDKDPDSLIGGKFPQVVYAITTAVLLVSIFMTGMLVSNLGLVFTILGAVASTGLMFYIPGFVFFKLFSEDARQLQEQEDSAAAGGNEPTAEVDAEAAGGAQAATKTPMMFGRRSLLIHRSLAMVLAITGVAIMVMSLVNIALESGGSSGPSA